MAAGSEAGQLTGASPNPSGGPALRPSPLSTPTLPIAVCPLSWGDFLFQSPWPSYAPALLPSLSLSTLLLLPRIAQVSCLLLVLSAACGRKGDRGTGGEGWLTPRPHAWTLKAMLIPERPPGAATAVGGPGRGFWALGQRWWMAFPASCTLWRIIHTKSRHLPTGKLWENQRQNSPHTPLMPIHPPGTSGLASQLS